jgi:hypothetical protein
MEQFRRVSSEQVSAYSSMKDQETRTLISLAALSMARSRSGQLILRCVLLHTPRLRRQSGVSSGFPRLPGPNASLPEVPIGVSLSTARQRVVEQGLTISHIASVPVLVYVFF